MITRLLSEENIYAFGWTVLHSLWQAFLVALIMGIVMLFLQKRSAQMRYGLANVALLIVFILSVITFINLRQRSASFGEAEMMIFIDGSVSSAVPESSSFQSIWRRFFEYFNVHLPMVVTIWLVGLAFLVLRMLGSLAYVEHLRQHGHPVSAFWQERLEVMKAALSVSRPVQLLESALAKTPMVIGVLKPVILMPLGAVNGLSPAEVEAVLAHELAHIRRSDYLFNIIQSILEVLYYFNPAVWWISANIRLERENCCDDLAVAFCGNSLIYAKALVKVEELSRRAPVFALAFSTGKNLMLNRVKRILNQSENRSNIMEKLTSTLLLLLAIAFFSISANQPIEERREPFEMEPLADAQNMAWRPFDGTTESRMFTERVLPEPLGKLATLPQRTIELLLSRDTLPSGKTTMNLTRRNGQKMEAKIKDGTITYLKIDGQEIPSSEYAQYESMLEDVLDNETPPPPPHPASAPLPPAPPTPQLAPMPPSPPTAPSAPSFQRSKSKKITTKKDQDGSTVIIIESNGDEPMEFRVRGDEKAIFMDGEMLEDGQVFIVDELHPSFEGNWFSPESLKLVEGANHLFGLADSNTFFFHTPEIVMELEKLHEGELKLHQMDVEKLRELTELEQQVLQKVRQQEHSLRQASEKEIQEKLADLKKQEQEVMQKIEKEMQIRERELADQIRRQEYTRGSHDGKMQKRLENEMLTDQLIKSIDGYKMELSTEGLKINGKKQSGALHKKYLEIYQETTGSKLEGKSKLVIDKSE